MATTIKANWEARDKAHADEIIDALISWTNADDESAITISRERCCYIRDEIERLRKVEKAVLADAERARVDAWFCG